MTSGTWTKNVKLQCMDGWILTDVGHISHSCLIYFEQFGSKNFDQCWAHVTLMSEMFWTFLWKKFDRCRAHVALVCDIFGIVLVEEIRPMPGTCHTCVRNVLNSFGGRIFTYFGDFSNMPHSWPQNKPSNIFDTNMWELFRTVLVEGIWLISGIF